ncbi:MAG: putative DNA-binding protein [Clostridia bacterium]|nr:putative DNA-binding protein [Clostridia bacterium]
MEEKIKMSILCSIYGKLLTEKQYEILNDYYNNDFSLSEIAENNEITRQAVKDVINKSNDKLLEYENKLSFMDKMLKQKACVNEIIDDLSRLKNKELTEGKINSLSKKLEQLIDE